MVVAGTAEQSSMVAAAEGYMSVALRRGLALRTCLRWLPVSLTSENGAREPGWWLLVSRSQSAECVLRGDERRLG
jgi:hypothetical protein